MSNYDFALDMETDNSNSLILKHIKEKSKVLEIGCAHGRMTKYMKERLHCHITIVEMDMEAGEIAAKYADRELVGPDCNIEGNIWDEAFEGERFEYIIFADVLEHLHNPERVLNKAANLLVEGGSIFISIPNIGHNSVLIDLLQGKFEYREMGILDKTHLKFFTYSSLKQMIASVGLTVANEYDAVNVVSNTEFKNSYNQLPEAVGEYLKSRKHGEVYQFVWELKKSSVMISVITPLYGKWNFTKSYLDDMLKLDLSKIEVILVDNASPDETAQNIQPYLKKNSNIKYIQNTTNEGFGKACSQAFDIANGQFVCFLNNDIKVKSDYENWIFKLVNEADDNNIVGPTGGKVDLSNEFSFLYETNDPTKSINYMSGWCLLAKKSVFDKIAAIEGSVFSKDFFVYFEDTNLSFEAANLGIKFKLVDIPVYHFGKVSSKQLNTYSLYKQSKDIFTKKWKHLLKDGKNTI